MYPQACLLLLAIAFATASGLQPRAVIPFRGSASAGSRTGSDAISPVSPTDNVPHIGDDIYRGMGGSGSRTPRIGDDTPTGSGSTASEQEALEYKPAEKPNECFREECAELTADVALKLVDLIQQLVDTSSTLTTAPNGFATAIQPPLVTAYSARPAIPNYNIATAMTLSQEDIALFDADEQDMYFQDRMCFYANAQRRYAEVAGAPPTPTLINRRGDVMGEIDSAMTAEPTPLAQTAVPEYQSQLWGQNMPNAILSMYEPVKMNGSMTTATTTCSGLGDAPSLTMSFIQARVTSDTPTATPDLDQNMVDSGASALSNARGSTIFGAIVAIMGAVMM